MEVMPGIPGVPPAAEPKVTDGDGCGAACRELEHPASNSAATATEATRAGCFRHMVVMPRDRAVGYTASNAP
jgi:hypothetical protein